MDTLRFELGERRSGRRDRRCGRLVVNGRNLVDILREVELPFAAREGNLDLAGSYVGLPPKRSFCPPHVYSAIYYDHDCLDGKVAILGCGCGEVGCWPFRVRVTLREDAVIWSDFEQPHRREWRYDELGPFVFDRTQYLSALSQEPG